MNLRLLIAALLFLTVSSTAYAKFEVPAVDEFDRKMNDFQKNEAIYLKDMTKKQAVLFKELEALGPDMTGKDPEKAKKARRKANEITAKISGILEEMAVHEVDSATFNIQVADHRLKKANERLASLREARKRLDATPAAGTE